MPDTTAFVIVIAALTVLAVWCGMRVRQEHRRCHPRTRTTVIAVYAVYLLHLALTMGAAAHPRWRIELPEAPSLVLGGVLAALGIFSFIAGVVSFRSLRRVSGIDTSKLITSGAYRWSRNPQNVGWSLLSFGIAVMGRSWLALLLALAFCVLFRLYVTSEEAFLERCFGHDYREYRGWSHRYFGPPGRRDRPEPAAPAGGESEERAPGAWKKRVRQGDIVP